MSKPKKHKITLSEAISLIPHDQCYCNDSGHCPYNYFREVSKTKYEQLTRTEKGRFKVITQYPEPLLEWCAFLNEPLTIQDGCKDCGINCDYPPKKHEEYLKWLEEEYKEKDPEYYQECLEEEKDTKTYIRRIENREYADFYKEKFPDEVELIDKIVEEDKLEYWHKEKKDE